MVRPTASQRERYQNGTLEQRPSSQGLVWYLRFTAKALPGEKPQRPRFRIGLVSDFPTRTKARTSGVAEEARKSFNDGRVTSEIRRTFSDLIARYTAEEMPERFSTAKGYRGLMQNHIKPRWGKYAIIDVRPQLVREWLKSLPKSSKTKSHIRNMMRILFNFAMLWEWIPAEHNPMNLFRIENASKRTREPIILSVEQFGELMQHRMMQSEPVRTLTFVACCLGLRRSEMLGLQWHDIDWVEGLLHVRRAMVEGHLGDVKTIYSRKPLPLDPALAKVLQGWRAKTQFKEQDDWVFASPHTRGEMPWRTHYMQHNNIRQAAIELKIGTGVGWHSFRHSYRAWLDNTGSSLGVQKDLMRHAHISTTMNVYGGTFVDGLRAANSAVVGMLIQ